MSALDASQPIEVWLSQPNIKITCTVVFEDESTDALSISSLSMRGAQREITGWLISQGYQPVGRWENESGTGQPECSRRFRPATVATTPPVSDIRAALDAAAVKPGEMREALRGATGR